MKRVALLVAMVLICLGCRNKLRHAKEQVLQEDLFTMRQSIDQFTQDQKRAPESLHDLVAHGYMRAIPKDPFTESELTWQVVYQDFTPPPQDTPALPPQEIRKLRGIVDVHSGSNQIAIDGT